MNIGSMMANTTAGIQGRKLMKLSKYIRRITIVIYIIILLLLGAGLYQNRSEIHKWCKTQIEICKRDCKMRAVKEQFLRLQQKYGPEGAIQS